MTTQLRCAAVLLIASFSTGCAIRMVHAEPIRVAPPGKALVTFVRPALSLGDGLPVDLWNGNHFIGVLLTGTMVQYEATPGEHLFMARSAENWSYASGVVAEGKRYYLKANFFPGFLTDEQAL